MSNADAAWLAELGLAPPTRSEKAVRAGRAANRHGHGFEGALDGLHAAYNAAERAWIVKVPAPYKVLGKPTKGRFTASWEGEGPPDYAGAVAGRLVAFDAKQTAADRWGFEALAPHQAQHFDRATKQGAYAFVLLWIEGAVWVLPWEVLGPRWWAWRNTRAAKALRATPGTASLSAADIAEIGHRCQGYDWLPVVMALLGGDR